MFKPESTGQILAALRLANLSVGEISEVTDRSRAALYALIKKDGDLRNLCLTYDQWQSLISFINHRLEDRKSEDLWAVINQLRGTSVGGG